MTHFFCQGQIVLDLQKLVSCGDQIGLQLFFFLAVDLQFISQLGLYLSANILSIGKNVVNNIKAHLA